MKTTVKSQCGTVTSKGISVSCESVASCASRRSVRARSQLGVQSRKRSAFFNLPGLPEQAWCECLFSDRRARTQVFGKNRPTEMLRPALRFAPLYGLAFLGRPFQNASSFAARGPATTRSKRFVLVWFLCFEHGCAYGAVTLSVGRSSPTFPLGWFLPAAPVQLNYTAGKHS